MKKILFCWALALLSWTTGAQTLREGACVLPIADGSAVRIEWYGDAAVRVVKTPDGRPFERKSLAVTARPQPLRCRHTETAAAWRIESARLAVTVDKQSGAVAFATAQGQPIVAEAGAARFTPMNDAGRSAWQVSQNFRLDPDEAIYGLGILQNGKMSQRGEERTLRPGNTEDGIPFFQSAKGYGIYWDNYSPTRISDGDAGTGFASETGDAVDYYLLYGGSADGVVAAVRALTGDVPMLPLWAYGFMQSRERYKSQQELLDVLHRYRRDSVPIDCMIQDWQYWGNNYLWNAMEFMSEQFPDPKGMLNEVHRQHARCMISIWSSFGPQTKPYRQLEEKGLLLPIETWPQSGISHQWPPRMDYPSGVRVYDCYSPEARDIYWNNLQRIHALGMDGWWMDSTEPDHFNWKASDFDHQTALGSYRSVLCAYPLLTVGGVYDHQRAVSDTARVLILTRSGCFGQQRYGANVWSGDVVSTWEMLRSQVPAGLNFSLTGNPNFNSDLGGFFAGSYNRSWRGKPAYENPAYRELYLRWMQQGVFTPMMRSHGADVPRELFYYGQAGEPVYDAMLAAIRLRYRLLPYIYSTAWQVSKHRDTFMRALAMDFAADPQAAARSDEYLFGRALLATPVLRAHYTPEVVRRDRDANAGWDKRTGRMTMERLDSVGFSAPAEHTVYLPAGSAWYYFADGRRYEGGAEVTRTLPIAEVPFFVRAGSILPLGPDVQWSGEKPWDALEVRIYPGANGRFTLYEDEFDSYRYEQGLYTEIDFRWDDRARRLTIEARRGSYPGMIEQRTFRLLLPDGTTREVHYDGKRQTVKF